MSFWDPFGLAECMQRGNCTQGDTGEKDGIKNEQATAMRRADAIQASPLLDPLAFFGPAEIKAAAVGLGMLGRGSRLVIGKMDDLLVKGGVREGEHTLLPKLADDLGSPKANWKRNAGALRAEMRSGTPIRDASINPSTGALQQNTGFLRAERSLLESRGWKYDPAFGMWMAP